MNDAKIDLYIIYCNDAIICKTDDNYKWIWTFDDMNNYVVKNEKKPCDAVKYFFEQLESFGAIGCYNIIFTYSDKNLHDIV